MSDIPTPRPSAEDRINALHAALDRSAARREELCDGQRRERHDIRLLHPKTDSGMCRTCRVPHPCPTVQVIDRKAIA